MWKNIVERGWQQTTIWRMRIAYWIPKATNTHSEYVILIAFPLQQWLQDRTAMLRFTYIACRVQRYVENTYTVWQDAMFITVIVFVIVIAGICTVNIVRSQGPLCWL